MQTHIIDLTPAKRGKASMFYLGNYLGDSNQPIYDAARILLKQSPERADDEIITRRGDTICLRSRVSKAAGRMVVESAKIGPTTRSYRPLGGRLPR